MEVNYGLFSFNPWEGFYSDRDKRAYASKHRRIFFNPLEGFANVLFTVLSRYKHSS